eukprot:6586240-Prymnesium_polylepis.1
MRTSLHARYAVASDARARSTSLEGAPTPRIDCSDASTSAKRPSELSARARRLQARGHSGRSRTAALAAVRAARASPAASAAAARSHAAR